ncbi:hypothetical protein ASE63_23125 [Bosea sp. Root381]|jgi:hypothetical protein|uniref:hypothetical protein n=1 Tax=Bosea sp. Root381 TaxID=1736524 RepID=UPI0006F7B9EF|nr:hypothetical protein [Bosea sp. Root381]KRE07141.1 hypothetical protein ASE63_23125 [Bosea sp. Root381]
MDRRSFLTALFGGAAATAIGGVATSQIAAAASAPLLERTALDELEAEFTQYRGPRHRRPRRQVCEVRRNRFGRRVRVCRWI